LSTQRGGPILVSTRESQRPRTLPNADRQHRCIPHRQASPALRPLRRRSACTQTGDVSYGTITPLYSGDLVGYATRDGSFRVAVPGNPFDIPQAQTNAAIRSALLPPYFVGSLDVLMLDPAAARRDTRLVLIFNATAPGAAIEACGPDRVETAAARPEVRIDAIFCAGCRGPTLLGRPSPGLTMRAWRRCSTGSSP
jgi:hypothetical protein